MAIALQKFVDAHAPPQAPVFPDADALARYQPYLPNSLLELWRTHGFGFYGDGLIQLIDPDRYKASLWGWLMRDHEDMSRLPIALTPFGRLIYYRRLSNAGDEDVSFLDPHDSSGAAVLTWSLDDFFNRWCANQNDVAVLSEQGLYIEAVSRMGALKPDEIFYFVPALRLGGARSASHLGRGDAAVQLSMLLQLT